MWPDSLKSGMWVFKIQSLLFQICWESGKCRPWANTDHTHPVKEQQRSPWWLSCGGKPGRGGELEPSSGSLFPPCTGTWLEPRGQGAKLRGTGFPLRREGPGSQPLDIPFPGCILVSTASSAPQPHPVSSDFVVPSTRDGIYCPIPFIDVELGHMNCFGQWNVGGHDGGPIPS